MSAGKNWPRMRIEERSNAETAVEIQALSCIAWLLLLLRHRHPLARIVIVRTPAYDGGKAREQHTEMRLLTENMSRPCRRNHSGVPSTFSATADTRAKETLYLISRVVRDFEATDVVWAVLSCGWRSGTRCSNLEYAQQYLTALCQKL